MNARIVFAIVCLIPLWPTGVSAQMPDAELLRQQVEMTEREFAATMADRDYEAFREFLSEEAVFFAGETPLEGKQEVETAWVRYFEGEQAPFSWEPESVVVLRSGNLALSSGPVLDPAGNRVATFQSVWRREADGSWRIVFDKGHRYCPPPTSSEDA